LHRARMQKKKKKNLLSTHYTKSVLKTDHSTPKSWWGGCVVERFFRKYY
jgi:hypothetical protein